MPQNITVPDLGDFKDVEVIDVLVKPGDEIDIDTPLITLETEKATLDVPSTAAGVVKSTVTRTVWYWHKDRHGDQRKNKI